MNRKDLRVLKNKALADCRPDWAFWTCNGRVLRNIYELANAIEVMKKETFCYHVNKDKKNDFAKWIKDVIDHKELAEELEGIMDKDEYLEILRSKIRELELA